MEPEKQKQTQQSSHKPSQKSSIFGDACPREVVLAQRTGKPEKEILAEEAMHEKLHLRLTPQQESEKLRLEDFIAELDWNLDIATDARTRDALNEELKKQRLQLEALTSRFEREAIDRAKHGTGVRPSERIGRARSADYEQDPFQEDRGHGRRHSGTFHEHSHSSRNKRHP